MATIGPYTFSETDASKTCTALGTLWRLRTEGRVGAGTVVAPVADGLAAALADHLGIDRPGGEPHTELAELGSHAARSGQAEPEVLTLVRNGLREASDALRDAGLLPDTCTGIVDQLSTSGGGVPKLAVPAFDITWQGVRGDAQRHREHHGRPWQAVCLWSSEVIESFARAGHPLHAGAAGENVTVRGLPWDEVRPPVRLRVGEALLEVGAFAVPCSQNARWFLDRDVQRIHHDRGPVSRVYATVLEPGRVRHHDDVVLEP